MLLAAVSTLLFVVGKLWYRLLVPLHTVGFLCPFSARSFHSLSLSLGRTGVCVVSFPFWKVGVVVSWVVGGHYLLPASLWARLKRCRIDPAYSTRAAPNRPLNRYACVDGRLVSCQTWAAMKAKRRRVPEADYARNGIRSAVLAWLILNPSKSVLQICTRFLLRKAEQQFVGTSAIGWFAECWLIIGRGAAAKVCPRATQRRRVVPIQTCSNPQTHQNTVAGINPQRSTAAGESLGHLAFLPVRESALRGQVKTKHQPNIHACS